MKKEQRFSKMFGFLSVLVLAAMLLSACGGSNAASDAAKANSQVLNNGKITICHATGNSNAPYDQLTLDFKGLVAHANHADDLIPAPAEGCPAVAVAGNNSGKISVCHATNSATNPYTLITVAFSGLNGHSKHTGDIIPAPAAGCPAVVITPQANSNPAPDLAGANSQVLNNGKITICHAPGTANTAYDEITLDFKGLVAHATHADDLVPAPAEGCPAVAVVGNNTGKISVCHATNSATNPYTLINIAFSGLNGHSKHTGDIIPAPDGACPPVVPTPVGTLESTDGMITICHATGSSKNPYVLITISINGLNGHGGHTGDIIPAPAAGCPK